MDVQSAAQRWAETWQRDWPARESMEISALYHEAASYRSSPLREAESGGALAYVALYHEAASYRSSPLREAESGGALAYVERQFAIEDDVDCRFGEPICSGDRAAVEWWASFIEAGRSITLAGATVLRFDSAGLVVGHVDYWVQSQGRTVPYADWGVAGHIGGSKGASFDD